MVIEAYKNHKKSPNLVSQIPSVNQSSLVQRYRRERDPDIALVLQETESQAIHHSVERQREHYEERPHRRRHLLLLLVQCLRWIIDRISLCVVTALVPVNFDFTVSNGLCLDCDVLHLHLFFDLIVVIFVGVAVQVGPEQHVEPDVDAADEEEPGHHEDLGDGQLGVEVECLDSL